MKLRNISIAEYIALDDSTEYDFAIKYALETQAKDVMQFGDMTKKPFGIVKDYQYMFSKPDSLNNFVKMYGGKKLQGLSVFKFFAFFRYMVEQVERINNIENALLSHTPGDDEVAAGLDRFNKFSSILQLDSLANGKILDYLNIRALPYEDCLTKLALDKERNDYQKDYQNIMSRKNKNHG
jgi:hypothetical protein